MMLSLPKGMLENGRPYSEVKNIERYVKQKLKSK